MCVSPRETSAAGFGANMGSYRETLPPIRVHKNEPGHEAESRAVFLAQIILFTFVPPFDAFFVGA